jgi:hypothetical protein
MIQMMCEQGESGGYFHHNNQTTTAMNGDDTTHLDLERWLDGGEEDEEEDPGTVLVFGRTQLFTGAMRQYVGIGHRPIAAVACCVVRERESYR